MVLEPLGKQFLELDINQRKLMLREQLKKHGAVRLFHSVAARPGGSIRCPRKSSSSIWRCCCRTNSREKQFTTMVNWGRFAELFGYNKDEDRFYLDQE